MNKTNILTVHCNHSIDVYYWLAGKAKRWHECSGGRYYYTDENWEELKDGNQVVNISWDQSYDDYLVVFRVEEECFFVRRSEIEKLREEYRENMEVL